MELIPDIYDDFVRPDAAGLGTTCTGQPWVLTGVGYRNAGIRKNRYGVDAGYSVYAYLDWMHPNLLMTASISAEPGDNSITPVWTLSTSNGEALLDNLLHFNSYLGGWALMIREHNVWRPGTLMMGSYAPLRTDGTVYRIGMMVRGGAVRLLLADGSTRTMYDSSIPMLVGRWLYWQLGRQIDGPAPYYNEIGAGVIPPFLEAPS